jgi:hypothetical protein
VSQLVTPVSHNGSGVRTKLVFVDLPVHYEFQISDLPLLEEGLIIEFVLNLQDPRSKRSRRIEGPHKIIRRKLVYTTEKPSNAGLTQYLEVQKID